MIERTGWFGRSVLVALSCFFLYFGVEMLIGAYRLNDALAFMAAFFAANLVILISAALLAGSIYRWVAARRRPAAPPAEDPGDSSQAGR